MGTLIFEFGFAFLIGLYLFVDIVLPSFTHGNYFWFYKSFKSSKEKTFKDELKEAERVYNDALIKMEHLKNSATDEAKKAEKDLAKAEEVLENAKKKIKNLKK
jgi:DNA-binding transcriptional regulator GbsR (MarR family)